jgi:hypothetical protein
MARAEMSLGVYLVTNVCPQNHYLLHECLSKSATRNKLLSPAKLHILQRIKKPHFAARPAFFRLQAPRNGVIGDRENAARGVSEVLARLRRVGLCLAFDVLFILSKLNAVLMF